MGILRDAYESLNQTEINERPESIGLLEWAKLQRQKQIMEEQIMEEKPIKHKKQYVNNDGILHDYCEKEVFKAVCLARWMIRECNYRAGLACYKAAKKHKVDPSIVASLVGQHGSRVKALRKKPNE